MAGTKRAANHDGNSASGTPSKKKLHNSQSALTSFFTSPSSKSLPSPVKTNGKQRLVDSAKSDENLLQEETDAQFAAQLAAQDDDDDRDRVLDDFKQRMQMDEELARKLHEEWAIDSSHLDTAPAEVEQDVASASSSSSTAKIETSASTSKAKVGPPPKMVVDLDALDAAIQAIPLGDDVFQFNPLDVDTSSWPTLLTSDGVMAPTTPYALLVQAFVLISSTRSRLAITTLLTNLLRVVRAHDPSSLLATVYLVSNHIAPPYDGIELGLGGSIVNKAIKSVTGKSARFLKQWWDKTGDPGDVAYEAKKDIKALVRPTPITVQKLFATLHTIARSSGAGSASQKLGHVTKLLVASRGEETRFLVRTFISHLRIQAVRTTIATALARTFALVEIDRLESAKYSDLRLQERASQLLVLPDERKNLLANATKPKERQDPMRLELMERLARAEKLVRQVRARHPNFGVIVPTLLSDGLVELSQHVPLRIGTPISPMLGSITRSLDAMHDKMGPRAFVSEFKYDGQRCQIHAVHVPRSAGPVARKSIRDADSGVGGKWVGKHGEIYVRLFSRHLEEMTEKYPDITDMVPLLMAQEFEDDQEDSSISDVSGRRQCITSFIMDAEVVAMGLDGRLLPFQTLANRSRKDVNLHDIKVKVGVFAFDLMYLDGESLLKTSFRVRRQLLHSRFGKELLPKSPLIARFGQVRSCESTDRESVARLFAQAQEYKCEGIMVKSLDHHWEAPSGSDIDSAAQRLEKLSDVVDDDMTMENEDENDAVTASAKGGKAAHLVDIDIQADIGKGVNGRGKALLSTYEPDKRCESWLKVKKDYVDGLGDSLDLVPIGAWHGMGRKATWWSPILLALYDPTTGVYQAVCKCISGFTDAFYKDLNVRYAQGSETCVAARYSDEDGQHSGPVTWGVEMETGSLCPDVWWKPNEVWEIRGADVTISPNYTAALGLIHEEKGLSIRFPRFMKRREDKSVDQASTPAQLAAIYTEQQKQAPLPDQQDPSTGNTNTDQDDQQDNDAY